MARKSRRSRRSRRRSRRSRGGKQLSKAEVKSIGNMAAKTQKDALAAQNKASKVMQDAQTLKARSLATGVPSLCKNPFMKNNPKELPKITVKFANLVFVLGILFCVLIAVYSSYRIFNPIYSYHLGNKGI